MATISLPLQVQVLKISGSFITLPCGLEGGDGVWKALFDASQTEEGIWQFDLPADYVDTPVLVLTYAMASATTNKVDMECKVMSIADGADVDTASFDTLNEITGGTTVPGTAGFRDTITIPLTNNDSMAAGETVLLHIQRDHDDTDDTATGDLELVGATFKYNNA